jgi:hypothetical protein
MPTQQEINEAQKAVNTGLSNSTNAKSLQVKRKREANKAEREKREKEEAAKAKCMFLSFFPPSLRGLSLPLNNRLERTLRSTYCLVWLVYKGQEYGIYVKVSFTDLNISSLRTCV